MVASGLIGGAIVPDSFNQGRFCLEPGTLYTNQRCVASANIVKNTDHCAICYFQLGIVLE